MFQVPSTYQGQQNPVKENTVQPSREVNACSINDTSLLCNDSLKNSQTPNHLFNSTINHLTTIV